MEAEKKLYVGTGKQPHENIINITLNLSEISRNRENVFEYNGSKYIKLTVMKKKEPDKYGKTHSVTIDTWKPEKKTGVKPTQISESEFNDESDNELPF